MAEIGLRRRSPQIDAGELTEARCFDDANRLGLLIADDQEASITELRADQCTSDASVAPGPEGVLRLDWERL